MEAFVLSAGHQLRPFPNWIFITFQKTRREMVDLKEIIFFKSSAIWRRSFWALVISWDLFLTESSSAGTMSTASCSRFSYVNSVSRESQTLWISAFSKSENSSPVTLCVNCRMLFILSCWLGNPQKSLTVFRPKQPSMPVNVISCGNSLIFTVPPATLYDTQHSLVPVRASFLLTSKILHKV